MKRILFASDFSPAAEQAFELTLTLAKAYHSRVILLHDYALTENAQLDSAWLDADSIAEIESRLRERALPRMREMAARLQQLGLESERVMVRGTRPGELIISQARRQGCDLIVMGSRGLDDLGALMQSSTSTYVLQHSPCPILIWPLAASVPAATHAETQSKGKTI